MAKPLFPDLVVNGETVPAALVAAEAQHHQAPKGKPGVAWRKAAEAIAIRTLLLQEARRLGLEARPDEIGPGQFETKEAALIGQLLDSAVEVNPPDEATIRAEWERVPEILHAAALGGLAYSLRLQSGGSESLRGDPYPRGGTDPRSARQPEILCPPRQQPQ